VKKFLEFLYIGDYFDNRSPTMDAAVEVVREPESDSRTTWRSNKKGKGSKAKRYPETEAAPAFLDASPEASKTLPPVVDQTVVDGEDNPLLMNVKLYIMADRYDVQPLKYLAKTKYEQVLVNGWNDSSFVASLGLLYEETSESDRMLKNIAITVAGAHAKVLVDRGEFATLCKSSGEIAFDILKANLSATVHKAHQICPSCGFGYNSYVQHINRYQCNNCYAEFC
jgi:ribosomal protein S27AE